MLHNIDISQMPSFAIQGNIDSSYSFSVVILNLGEISSSQTSVVYLGTDFKAVSGQSSGVTVIQNTTEALIDYNVSEISEQSGSQRCVEKKQFSHTWVHMFADMYSSCSSKHKLSAWNPP